MQLEKLIEGKNNKWVLFTFNSEEDLVLLGRDSRLFVIDPVQEEVKNWVSIDELSEDADSLVDGAKFDQKFNTLVFKATSNRFYHITNITRDNVKKYELKRFARLDLQFEEDEPDTLEFAFKQEYKDDSIELVVADPKTGIHVVKDYEESPDYREFGLVETGDGENEIG